MAATKIGAAGGLVRDRASAADVALASWCSKRSAVPPSSSGGAVLVGSSAVHGQHTEWLHMTLVRCAQRAATSDTASKGLRVLDHQ